MIQIDPAEKAWLDSDSPRVYQTLVEIYTMNGNSYYYSDGDIDLAWQGRVYSANGPMIERDSVTRKLGIEVSESQVTFRCRVDHEIDFLPFVQAARVGQLDSARIVLREVAFAPGEYTPRVVVHLFEGQTGELDIGRYTVQMQVLSYLIQLNTQIPRGSYQPQCLWTLYDGGCRVNRSAWTRNVVAQAGSSRLSVLLDQAMPDGQYAGGTITGINGGNEGISRTVRMTSGNTVDLMIRLPADVLPGDLFALAPTCNRSMARCQQFGNLARYRGTPFVPQPEASV